MSLGLLVGLYGGLSCLLRLKSKCSDLAGGFLVRFKLSGSVVGSAREAAVTMLKFMSTLELTFVTEAYVFEDGLNVSALHTFTNYFY